MIVSNSNNHIAKFLSILSILVFGSLLSTFLYAESKIKISGHIVEEPCELVNDDIKVDFGKVTNKDLFYGNDEEKPFEIEFINCKLATFKSLEIIFNGDATENNQLLNVNTVNRINGVGIKIMNDSNNIITFGQTAVVKRITSANNTVLFKAILTKKSTTTSLNEVLLGPFTATSTFIVKYE